METVFPTNTVWPFTQDRRCAIRAVNAPIATPAPDAQQDTLYTGSVKRTTTSHNHMSPGPRTKVRQGVIKNEPIITPIKASRLNLHLKRINSDHQFSATLASGFTHGFRLHHQGEVHDITPPNSAKVYQIPEVLRSVIASEVAANRISGPYADKSF